MRKVLLIASILISGIAYGQTPQKLGSASLPVYNPGMFFTDSISSVFANLDTATVRAAFPTQRMFGRVGFANGLPYIFNGTNWIRMYGVDTSGLSNRIDDKIDGTGISGYVPVFSGSKTIIQSPLQVNDASISYPDAFDLNRETGIYKLGDIDDHANQTKIILNDNNRSITVDADSLIADDIYNNTGEKYITINSIEDAIVNNVTDKAPSQNIVSDSLSVLQTRKLNKADSSTAYFTPRQVDSVVYENISDDGLIYSHSRKFFTSSKLVYDPENNKIILGEKPSFATIAANDTINHLDFHGFEDWQTLQPTVVDAPLGYCSFDAKPTIIYGTGSHVSHLVGYQSRPIYSSTDTVRDYWHGYDSRATITDGYINYLSDFYSYSPSLIGSARIRRYESLHLSAFAGADTNYAIYSPGSAISYFNGVVQTSSNFETGIAGGFMNNIYYSSGWKRRNSGTGWGVYQANGKTTFYGVGNGAALSAATLNSGPSFDTSGYFYTKASAYSSGSFVPMVLNLTTTRVEYPTASQFISWAGLPSQTSLTGSGDGSSTAISVTLPASATWVMVGAKNAAAAGITYWTVSGTTLTVNYAVAPASGTNNLSYWVEYK